MASSISQSRLHHRVENRAEQHLRRHKHERHQIYQHQHPQYHHRRRHFLRYGTITVFVAVIGTPMKPFLRSPSFGSVLCIFPPLLLFLLWFSVRERS